MQALVVRRVCMCVLIARARSPICVNTIFVLIIIVWLAHTHPHTLHSAPPIIEHCIMWRTKPNCTSTTGWSANYAVQHCAYLHWWQRTGDGHVVFGMFRWLNATTGERVPGVGFCYSIQTVWWGEREFVATFVCCRSQILCRCGHCVLMT